MTDQLEPVVCGHTTRIPSIGIRACTEPASHPGWHRHTDPTYAVLWATDEAAAAWRALHGTTQTA